MNQFMFTCVWWFWEVFCITKLILTRKNTFDHNVARQLIQVESLWFLKVSRHRFQLFGIPKLYDIKRASGYHFVLSCSSISWVADKFGRIFVYIYCTFSRMLHLPTLVRPLTEWLKIIQSSRFHDRLWQELSWLGYFGCHRQR